MKEMDKTTRVDRAYAAGIIDGEGCISIVRCVDRRWPRPHSYQLRLSVGMGLPEIPYWLHSTFGGWISTYRREYDTYARDITTWTTSGPLVLRILKKLTPFLKEKCEQSAVAMEFQSPRVQGKNTTDEQFQREKVLFEKLRELKKRGRILFEGDKK